VRGYLVDKGVPADRIHAEGRGESEPVKECADDQSRSALIECLKPNRRVELVVRANRPA
jgi:outer membrane protein OmpA-like peptidoglycan-associated protein